MTDLAIDGGIQATTLIDILRANAASDPGAVAFAQLTYPAGTDTSDGRGVARELTRGTYDRRSAALAAALAPHLGPAGRVLVLLAPGLDFLVGLTGVMYAGGVAVACPPPVDGAGDPRTERAVQIAGNAEVSVVVTTAELADRLTELRGRLGPDVPWLAVDRIDEAAADGWTPPVLTGDDLALLQYTSGSTGAPKGVMVSHRNLLHQIDQTVALAGLPPGANVVSWISPYHALGVAGHLLLSQYLGGRAVFLTPEDFVADPLRWLRAISDTPGPVFGCAPNFAFERCLSQVPPERRAGLDLSGWHTTFNAAERVRAATIARFTEEFRPHGFRPETMAPGFGMTEAMLFLTGRHADPEPLVLRVDAAELEQGRVVPVDGDDRSLTLVGVGPAGPHCDVLVVDPATRTACADDRVGELWVRGPVVCQGYWQRPELTEETFGARLADGTGPFLRTGDLGFRHDGDLVLCGRLKEMIIIRGRNLYPQDVEMTCERVHPALAGAPAAAFAVDTDGEERLVVVQSIADTAGVDLDGLVARLRAAITDEHEVEAHEVLLVGPEGVAKTVSGKVQRGACRDRYLAGEVRPLARAGRPAAAAPAGPAPAAAPMRDMLLALDEALRTPVLVAELRRRLAAMLGTTADRVATDLPLAGLGLESLRAIELRRDLERDLGVGIPIAEFMRGTVAGLAELITGQLDAAPGGRDIAWRPVVADPEHRHEPFPLTEQQYAYFVGRSAGYDLGEVSIHIYVEVDAAELDVDRLARALNRLVARQEMLRAVVRSDGTQQILPADEVPPIDIAVADLSEVDPEQRDARLAKTRDELSHQVLPMDHWPMFEVRASLLPGTTRVHVSLDLLVADVASVRLFFLEWGDHYADLDAHPDPLPVSFRDYVLALDQVAGSEAYRRSRDYWLTRIPDLPPGPDLPLVAGADRRRRRRRSHLLDAGQWARLRDRAARRGVTPSVVQLAAFAEVLGRWSGTGRFTINVPLFNRMPLHPRIDDVIGDFTAVTLLEIDITPRDGLGGLAERIQRQLWQDLEHRYFSGVEVMRELSRQRGVPPGTFATVVFASAREQGRDQEGEQGALGAAWLGETVSVISQTPQVLFDHQVYEDHGALSYHWDVIEDLFPEAMLDDLFAAYTDLLERLAASDDAWAPDALDPLPVAQRELVAAANAATAEIPDELLFTAIGRQAAAHPGRTAVVAADASLTYAQLWRRATALGRTLRAAGVRPNQLVAVAADKSAAQLVAALGVQLAGGAYLPIDPELPPARQDHQLRRAEVGIVLVRAGGPDRDDWPDGIRVVPVDAGADPAGEVAELEPAQRPEDLAYVLFTSGSTGTPKGVMLSHRATLTTVAQVRERCGLGPDDVALGLSALSFDLSVWDVFGVLGAGATLVLPEPAAARDPGRWLELMAAHGVTTWNSVPALARMLVEQAEPDGGHPGLAGLRLMWLSGDWIPVDLPDRVRALAPDVRFVASGGPTETAIWCVAYDVERVDPDWESIPYGRPLPNHRIHVLNDRMQPCPVGVPGEMFIGGAGLADGYWRDPELTAASFVTHPETGERLYRSGDLGRWLPDGTLQILGRNDHQVKIGGFRIELGEIEATLSRHPRVRQAAVVAAGPDRHRRRLVAFVVPDATGGGTAGPAGTDLDPKVAEKKVLGDVEGDPVRRAEFTLARKSLRTDLTGTPIDLPSALDDAGAEEVWARRASRRSFADRPVPLTDLARLLECLRSRDGEVLPKYRYASAGALYPVQTYVHVRPGRVDGLPGGSYYHDPVAHRLVPVRPDADLDRAAHVSTNQPTYDGSAFEIFLVGRMAAITPLYGTRALHFCLLEAGEMSQLLDENAPGLQLGLCQLGLMADERAVRDLLALDDDDQVLHILLGGVLDPAPQRASGGTLADRLRAHAAETLPHYMVPGTVVTLDRLPLSARGKVDRAALERLAESAAETGQVESAAYVAPTSEVERTATEVFRKVLGVDRIGVDDRFFDLGADSVTIVKIYRELCAALGRTFPLMQMFEHPTIRRLAAGLDGGGTDDDAVDDALRRAAARRGRRAARPVEVSR